MKLILKYTWRYKKYLLLSVLGVLGFVCIQMGLPTLLKYVINDALMGENRILLLQLVLIMLGVVIVGISGEICMSYANSRIASNVIRDIRSDIFIKTQSFSHGEYNEFSVSGLITSTTSDAYQIMLFVQNMLRSATITPIMTITGFVLIIKNNPQMLWTILATVPILLLGILFINLFSRRYSKAQQSGLDKINRILREGLSGLRVIRAFGNENFQEQRFSEVNDEYCIVSKKAFRLTALAQPGFYFLFNTIITLVIWFGSKAIGENTLDVGALSATIEYIFHILFSFLMLALLFTMYPRASVSAERIQRILDCDVMISENLEEGKTETRESGTIVFENVTFQYPDAEEPMLKNISFTVNKGETVAFIGSTGSGKSTLIQLIPRMYDINEGRILVDGIDVRDFNIKALRNRIGFIPQKAQLFTGTIADNLRLGNPKASQTEIEKAAQIAQASDFIEEKTYKYEEKLSEGGGNLSGGQKQRLAIARAIVKNPEIYIFDDSFSALDYATDLNLRTQLRKEITNATVLIVAQRVGTIRHADKIIVLDEGKIVAWGTHEELLKTSNIYYDIAISQLSEEELA
ncbi:ABC transporter ATP-binding protein [Paratissierella segnis]|jgi:ATP-binding cassette subfamily B multidrug efflux pump|uniref:ABC transporter ATP-binding protein n=1 Tax=Paratissierella segnis TaxID=2763679 RepID=A0A926EST3_9FIRM|nr:ABC transporter ATP-binding protein [Paratissierella segnis]MBC8586787.1 ABC transporter ATP-binding protein [Paratissierella segnis]